MIWHSSTPSEVLSELNVDAKCGLANGEVSERLEEDGKNVVVNNDKMTFWGRLMNQLNNKLVIVLIITALVSFLLSLVYDTVNGYLSLLLIGIVLLNAVATAYHIYKCDNALDKIKQHTNPTTMVLRDGLVKEINAAELVPGDIILLQEGDFVPADARINKQIKM